MKHVSFDIESMGRSPDGAIVSLGAVKLNPITGEVGGEFYVNIDLVDVLRKGMAADPHTIMWWMRQKREAREALWTPDPVTLDEALTSFNVFFGNSKCLWSHITFDQAILDMCYRRSGVKRKYHYRDTRDLRTLYELAGGRPIIANEDKHNALSDAKAQAQEIIWCYKQLGLAQDDT